MRSTVWLSVVVCAALVATPVRASVDEAWLEVQEVLSAPDERSLDEPVEDLVRAAEEIDVRRLTPYAAALVEWSINHPEDADTVLETAIRFDPQLPAAHFLLSSRQWRAGEYRRATASYARGWLALVGNEVTRRHLVISVGIWLLLGLVAASLVTMLLITLRTVRRTVSDAMSVGGMIFERGNAIVFGAVLVLLPVFAGLGPAWLLVYLFVAGWIYLDHGQRAPAIGLCVVMALVPVLLEFWQRALVWEPPVTKRVAVMLEDRQLNPSALREFLDLKPEVDDSAQYHLILGELFRMHSAIESAKVEFQTAANDPGGDSRPYVFLGNIALEDGNVQLAIQDYDSAIEIDGRTVLAYHNLSSAYDLIRRFQQGDLARARARELAGGRSAALGVRGRDPRVRYPRLTADDVEAFEDSLSDEARLQLGYGASALEPFRQLLHPVSVMFWLAALIGVVLLVVRSRWFPEAKECTKCGKVYRLENEPGESPVYCRQCVSVFLQRDLVPIDQQTVKLAQVRRWDRWSNGFRRVVSAVAPGEALILGDRVALGLVLAVVSWIGVVGLAVWVPRFLSSIEPALQVQPVIAVLAAVVAVCWAWSIMASWRRS